MHTAFERWCLCSHLERERARESEQERESRERARKREQETEEKERARAREEHLKQEELLLISEREQQQQKQRQAQRVTHTEAIIRRVVIRMSHACLSAAFAKWWRHVEDLVQLRVEHMRKQCFVRRTAERMMHQGLSMCLDLWASYTCEEVRKRRLVTRIAARITGNLFDITFQRWGEGVFVQRGESAEAERKLVAQRLQEDRKLCLMR
jgi:hypothetical protein